MTHKFVDQKWPAQIFPTANFLFSHDGQFDPGGVKASGGGGGAPPMVLGRLMLAW